MKARNIGIVCTIPDGGLTLLLDLVAADATMRLVTLTTEAEGIGIATGCWLGGSRAMTAMQSSGIGNSLNALALPAAFRAPCLLLVTMRGQWGEFNPWQIPMGKATQQALEIMGVTVFRLEQPEDAAEIASAAASLAFDSDQQIAVLISQRMIGRKKWTETR